MSNFNPFYYFLRPMLEEEAKKDELFAKTMTKPNKSLEECAEYIYGEAYKYAKEHQQGNCGMAGLPDAELISMAKHYYDEDDIKITKPSDAIGKVAKATHKASPAKAAKTPAAKQAKAEATKAAEPKKDIVGDLFANMFS